MTDFLDEPLGDASIVPTYLLSRFTRGQVTVALSGDGGDELFAGYPTFAADRAGRLFFDRLPAAAQRLAGRLAGRLPARTDYFSLDFKLNQFLRGGPRAGPRRHQRWLSSFLPEELGGLLDPALAQGLADPLDDVDQRARTGPARHAQDRLMDFYARFYLAERRQREGGSGGGGGGAGGARAAAGRGPGGLRLPAAPGAAAARA